MKRISLAWFQVIALMVSLNMLSCNGSSGGGGSSSKLLDTTFGTNGKVTTAIGTNDDEITSLKVQADGKLVAAGFSDTGSQFDFALIRYNTDGSLDSDITTGFNPTGPIPGTVTTAIGTTDDKAFALAIQSVDGKLVVAGHSNNGTDYDFALVRYNTDGTLDTSFGTGFGTGDCSAGGCVTTDINGFDDEAFALAIQSDGKIVVAGYTDTGSKFEFALIRYNTNGSLDASFGTGGIVTTDINGIDDTAFALAIQSNGKLVAAGYSATGVQREFALVRYNDTDGTLDTTFNTTGIVTTAIGSSDDVAFALAIQSDGKLVAAGSTDTGSQFEFTLVRYNDTDGSLDTAFNTTGIVTTAIGTMDDTAFALAIQSDGKLVAAGYTAYGTSPSYKFALVRYNGADGSLDTTFNKTGKITTAIGTIDDTAFALTIQSDGKLVAAGYSANGVQNEFAMVRYMLIP